MEGVRAGKIKKKNGSFVTSAKAQEEFLSNSLQYQTWRVMANMKEGVVETIAFILAKRYMGMGSGDTDLGTVVGMSGAASTSPTAGADALDGTFTGMIDAFAGAAAPLAMTGEAAAVWSPDVPENANAVDAGSATAAAGGFGALDRSDCGIGGSGTVIKFSCKP